MNLSDDLKDARLNMKQTAELVGMHPAHLRRLVRDGTFPPPRYTAKGRPFFDYALLAEIDQVLRTGIGANGEEVMFYRRRSGEAKNTKRSEAGSKKTDDYMKFLIAGLKQVGVPCDKLEEKVVGSALSAEFGQLRPDLKEALRPVARRLLQ